MAAGTAYNRAYYLKNREKLLAKSKAWQRAHPEYGKAKYAKHRAYHRMHRYGVTDEQYQAMLESQDGLCRICLQPMDPPHVDHDHATGLVRGLLCDTCNAGIGMLQDSPEILDAAIHYLTEARP